jgi:hypothetical protein
MSMEPSVEALSAMLLSSAPESERWAFLHAGVERLGLLEEGRHHDGELDGFGILVESGGLKFGVGPDSDRPRLPRA